MERQLAAARVVALPGWWSSVAEAERQAARTVERLPVRTACTHVVDGIALATVELQGDGAAPGPTVPQPGHHRWSVRSQEAVDDHAARYGGRLFVFPGQERLRGTMTAAEVLAASVVDELVVPGHPGPVQPEAVVTALDYVRPVYRQGRVVLTLRPVRPGVLSPFESPSRVRGAGRVG